MLRGCLGIDRHRPVRSLELALTAVALLIGLAGPARSDALSDFYKGKDVRVLTSTTPGTGHDTYEAGSAGFSPVATCGADFATLLRKQYDDYGRIIREARIGEQ